MLVGLGKEARVVGKINYHPERDDPYHYSGYALENEDPRPSPSPADAVHFANGCREETSERAGHRCRREEHRRADAEFVPFVPARQIVIDPREQAGFGEAEEEPCRHETGPIMADAHQRHAKSPRKHDGWDEDAGSEAFEKDIGDGFR